jgi:hypothetical protein
MPEPNDPRAVNGGEELPVGGRRGCIRDRFRRYEAEEAARVLGWERQPDGEWVNGDQRAVLAHCPDTTVPAEQDPDWGATWWLQLAPAAADLPDVRVPMLGECPQ